MRPFTIKRLLFKELRRAEVKELVLDGERAVEEGRVASHRILSENSRFPLLRGLRLRFKQGRVELLAKEVAFLASFGHESAATAAPVPGRLGEPAPATRD